MVKRLRPFLKPTVFIFITKTEPVHSIYYRNMGSFEIPIMETAYINVKGLKNQFLAYL